MTPFNSQGKPETWELLLPSTYEESDSERFCELLKAPHLANGGGRMEHRVRGHCNFPRYLISHAVSLKAEGRMGKERKEMKKPIVEVEVNLEQSKNKSIRP